MTIFSFQTDLFQALHSASAARLLVEREDLFDHGRLSFFSNILNKNPLVSLALSYR